MPKQAQSICSASGTRRTFAIFALVAFSLQLIRFYLVVPRDAFICSELNHHHEVADQSDHADKEFSPLGDADKSYFQHCKETLDGSWLTPAQPLGMPVSITLRIEPQVWLRLPVQCARPNNNALPPPFQPPRYFA